MSVFQYATQVPFGFSPAPPSYTQSPISSNTPPPTYKPSPSTLSIPSISKLSFPNFSLAPITRIFSSSTTTSTATASNHSREISHFSTPSSTNSSVASLSTTPTHTTTATNTENSSISIEQIENIAPPPPTYSPIKTPKLKPNTKQPISPSPPAYEPQSQSQSQSQRPQTPGEGGGRPAFTTPYSTYEEGYYGRYVGEEWAVRGEGRVRNREADGGMRDGEEMGEKGEEKESCWCGGWWIGTGSPTMPWVAYYVF